MTTRKSMRAFSYKLDDLFNFLLNQFQQIRSLIAQYFKIYFCPPHCPTVFRHTSGYIGSSARIRCRLKTFGCVLRHTKMNLLTSIFTFHSARTHTHLVRPPKSPPAGCGKVKIYSSFPITTSGGAGGGSSKTKKKEVKQIPTQHGCVYGTGVIINIHTQHRPNAPNQRRRRRPYIVGVLPPGTKLSAAARRVV